MDATKTYEQLYRETIPSVVSIYVNTRGGASRSGAGSGFVYDREGHVVTNEHVVGESDEVELRFSGGEWRTGRVAGTDVHTDLAVVRVDALPDYATPLPVATENPTPGTQVAALGNPMGLDGTITAGIVSGTNRSMVTGNGFAIPDTVQTDAPINPGNSGGPLVTLRDGSGPSGSQSEDGPGVEVVGVNRARQGDNIGFAISPEIVSRVVPDLVDDGAYHHPYLRVRTLDVSPVVAEANDLDEPVGVLVVDVSLGPASGALRECRATRSVRGRELPVGGDVIVSVNDCEIRSHEELMRYLIINTRPGEPVSVEVVRDGERVTERLTLGERPRSGGSAIPVR